MTNKKFQSYLSTLLYDTVYVFNYDKCTKTKWNLCDCTFKNHTTYVVSNEFSRIFQFDENLILPMKQNINYYEFLQKIKFEK